MSAKKRTGKGSGKGEDFKQEDVLQAVIIADSFNVRFAPITLDKPRALLPLVNVPLIDYTLGFLSAAGIEEVIIFCCAHAAQIRRHIENSKWALPSSPVEVNILVSETCLSVGDALREIDSQSLIHNDFVLVNGDIVSNMQIKEVIQTHKNRRLKEKTTIMTLVYKNAPPGQQTRCKEDDLLLAINPTNDRILHYQKAGSISKFDLPLNIFQENMDVDLRYDLLDCHVSICSPQVPALFTDNFDYLTKDDFIRGILVNEEILGNSIHVHVLEEEYAARVGNLQMYDSISKDVINRWAYPMVPDQNISDVPCGRYSFGRHNIYLHKDVTLARGCVLVEGVVIGQGSSVGANTRISQSVIGRNCTIGENVKLQGAYIWDGVTIEDNSSVCTSVIADEVQIKSGVTINPGCVIASKVILGPDIDLPGGSLLMFKTPVCDDDFGDEQPPKAEIDPSIVGKEGVGYIYEPPQNDDEVDDLVLDTWPPAPESDEEDVSDSDSDGEEDGISPSESPVPEDDKMFYKEVIGTLERALEENITTENMILEINSLKHAYNIQINEVNQLVTKALLNLAKQEDSDQGSSQFIAQVKKILKTFLPLLQNYIRNEESQHNCLTAMEDLTVAEFMSAAVMMKLTHYLYDVDILEEEAILRWHKSIPKQADDVATRKDIRKKMQPLIQWLEEAEEDSDD